VEWQTILEPARSSHLGLFVALGIGLLIGAERERRKRDQASAAGIRTFTAAALAGAVSFPLGGPILLAVTTAITGVLVALSYWAARHGDDRGLTTEVALVLTVLLGALATHTPGLAAMTGAVTAIMLAARTPLHRFVSSVLSERESWDAMIFVAATLIVLPLLPDRAMDSYGVLNPRNLWLLVILVLMLSAAGYVATRLVGAQHGLPLAGFLGGFVSSTATVGAMGSRARRNPPEAPAAAAGAVLSTVATMIQLALLLAAISPATLRIAAPSLLIGSLVAVVFGIGTTLRAVRRPAADDEQKGRAFSLKSALLFAVTVAVVLLASAAAESYFGERGLIVAAAIAGIVDAHASAISLATMVSAGQVRPTDALIPILLALSTNTTSKLIVAGVSGGRRFFLRVGPGVVLVALGAWAPLLWRS